ncbi:MAG: hypothetical protein VX620_17935 [Pseudomonadota bacterium]|nr:hypothetical protein [Pseudomonadota bacterium]
MFCTFKRIIRNGALVTVIGLLAACSQKAETLKLSVTQFGTATETAFDGYDAAFSAQFAPFSKSADAQRDEFVRNMAAFTGPVTPSNIETLLDPDAVKISPTVRDQWTATLRDLRNQYQQFVAIFDNIEAGSVLGASAVTQSGPILEKLRMQLATITSDFARNPPTYLTRRSTLIAELNTFRKDDSNDPEARDLEYQIWWQRWQGLLAEEQAMQSKTLRAFLTATKLGDKLQGQIDNYARLDVASLIGAVEQGITLADQINKLSPQELVTQGTGLLETATQ